MEDFCEVVALRAGSASLREIHVTIRELPLADGVHGSTGNQLWPAGSILAQELLRRPQLVQDRFILDLGAGCGLAGLAAAALGARRVLLTDCDGETVCNIHHNIQANRHLWGPEGGNCEVQAEALDWKRVSEDYALQERADVVISSDTVYGHFGDDLACCALNLLSSTGSMILVAPKDRQTGVPAFLERMKSAGYMYVESWVQDEHGEDFHLFDLKRRESTAPS